MTDCLFCKIAARDVPAQIVYESDEVVGFEDIAPQAPHHVLFVPRRHIESSHVLGPGDAETLAALFGAISAYADEVGIADSGYRVVTNVGSGAGQSVFHLHLHLLGGRQMLWPPG